MRTWLPLIMFLIAHPSLAQEWDEPTEETEKLTASEGAEDDFFGMRVAVSGDVAVAGAPSDVNQVGPPGSVFVFRYDEVEGEWVEEDELAASDGVLADSFGRRSVAVSGDVIVVGAHGDDDDDVIDEDEDNGTASGSAYVFRYDEDESEWVEEQKLTAFDGADGDWFGYAVAVSGEVIVIGAFLDDEIDSYSGSAYVFRYDADEGEWVEEEKFVATDGEAFDYFGASVDVVGDVVVVGAPGDDESGSAYIFGYDIDRDEWSESQKITASRLVDGDNFGGHVALSGDVVVIGAPRDDDNGNRSGAAYTFRYDPDEAEWAEEQKLTASDGGEDEFFGDSISVFGRVTVIGAHREGSGKAYMFRYHPEENEWLEEQKLTASDGGEDDRFGVSVSVARDWILVGAYGDDDDGSASGSAYVFLLQPRFLRGDVDGDGNVSVLVDALSLLNWFFADGEEPPCMVAADVDDNGSVSALIDALYLLQYGFTDGEAPPDPGTEACGEDPTENDLSCDARAKDCL